MCTQVKAFTYSASAADRSTKCAQLARVTYIVCYCVIIRTYVPFFHNLSLQLLESHKVHVTSTPQPSPIAAIAHPASLINTSEHDNDGTLLLPHHLPKVLNCLRDRTLSCNVGILYPIALKGGRHISGKYIHVCSRSEADAYYTSVSSTSTQTTRSTHIQVGGIDVVTAFLVWVLHHHARMVICEHTDTLVVVSTYHVCVDAWPVKAVQRRRLTSKDVSIAVLLRNR